MRNMEKVYLVAAGYEWLCPDCEGYNKETSCTKKVTCGDCGNEFEAEPPEHAYN